MKPSKKTRKQKKKYTKCINKSCMRGGHGKNINMEHLKIVLMKLLKIVNLNCIKTMRLMLQVLVY